jgi:hypothetical protein
MATHPWQFWTLVAWCAVTFLVVLVNEIEDEEEKPTEAERRENVVAYWIWFSIAVAVVFLVSVYKTGYYVWPEKDLLSMIGATVVVIGGGAALAVLLSAGLGWIIAQSLVWFCRGVALVFGGVRVAILFIRDDLGLGQAWQTIIGWLRRFRERLRELMRNRSHG